MRGVIALEKEITHYLGRLNMQQKKVVLSVIKSIAGEEDNWWEEKAFVAEMDKRYTEMKTDPVYLFTLEQAETKARQVYKG